MTRRGLMAASLIAGCAALAHADAAGPMIATSKTPAQHCANYDRATTQALGRGERRLVVVLRSFQPPKSQSSAVVVWRVTADKTRREEVARFAVHPLRAFSARESGKEQRFILSLEGTGLDDRQPICLEIGFDVAGGKLEGGVAEFEIELTDRPAPRAK